MIATAGDVALIKGALADIAILKLSPSPAHGALRLAIWSDKKRIPAEEVERLRVLWGRWF